MIQVANSKVFAKLGNGAVRDLTLDTNTVYTHPTTKQCTWEPTVNMSWTKLFDGWLSSSESIIDISPYNDVIMFFIPGYREANFSFGKTASGGSTVPFYSAYYADDDRLVDDNHRTETVVKIDISDGYTAGWKGVRSVYLLWPKLSICTLVTRSATYHPYSLQIEGVPNSIIAYSDRGIVGDAAQLRVYAR